MYANNPFYGNAGKIYPTFFLKSTCVIALLYIVKESEI